ncbi:alpha/beta hydrolase [Bacillus tianshenii]|nr:alpha/beta hydrolase [Bacillus tianshenii]
MTFKKVVEDIRTNGVEYHTLKAYRDFYGLDFEVEHEAEYINSGNEKLFLQRFQPSNAKRAVLLVHGYLDHSGQLREMIAFLLQHEVEVYTFDLVGHGLSSGEAAHIESFIDYITHLQHVISTIDKPLDIIAHSTGGAAVVDLLLSQPVDTINKVVLLAPLVRSYRWHASMLGKRAIAVAANQIKRTFKRNSHHESYLTFVKKDPLQATYIPFTWLDALEQWQERFETLPQSSKCITILQGTGDTTVDWRYNMNALKKKFPNADILLIDKALHQLWNEKPLYRTQIFTHIARTFELT